MSRHYSGKVNQLLKIPAKLAAMLFSVTGTKATSRSEMYRTLAMESCINKEKIFFLNRGFTHFQINFSIFQIKNNHHSNIRRNMFDVKKIKMFELIF